ncbi:longevity assurance protein [Tritrichomonas foetus]|uniref:Longevity assurance protein n=1 Tax=Tritrichomonas foetus TaxID=1144522 RepID=A0A1J4J6E3_9EUKA|nr:longevity assurance protein [Tritrichomonas foetus]|eukprot:OHS94233.1 longevity assurance protein [Tritrichomonas foetus]
MYDIHQLTTLTTDDLPLFGSICAFYLVYRLAMSNLILKKIATFIKVKFPAKFIHRSFDLIHYTSSALLGLYALSSRPYGHCAIWARDCVEDIKPMEECYMSEIEKVYFMIFAAYYVVDVLFIYTSNDKVALILHHMSTLSMIFLCIYLKVQILGMIIMLLHDVVDVPLYLGKILTYLGYETGKDLSLVTFAILCTWFRMVNYPTVIFDAYLNGVNCQMPHKNVYWFTWSLLLCLMGLHIYWFMKILKAVVGIIRSGKEAICDNRSESD